jgi:hypothetical protein
MAVETFGPWPLFHFLILYKVGRTPWTGDQPVLMPLPTHRTRETKKNRTQTSMPPLGFEPTTPVFERAKTVHALESTTTGSEVSLLRYINYYILQFVINILILCSMWYGSLKMQNIFFSLGVLNIHNAQPYALYLPLY